MFARHRCVLLAMFGMLMLLAWIAWWESMTGHSLARLRVWYVAAGVLFLSGFVIRRIDRFVALVGWLSVLAMLVLSVLLPMKSRRGHIRLTRRLSEPLTAVALA